MSADIVRQHFRNGDLRLALVAVNNALASATEPEIAELWALAARANARLGDPRSALRAAEEATRRSGGWEAALALGEAWIGNAEPWRARSTLQEALERSREARPRPPEAEVWLGVALADACRAAGDPEAGIAAAIRAETWAIEHFGPTTFEVTEAMHAHGMCLHAAGRDERAREVLAKCLAIRRKLDPTHPDVAATLDALGLVERGRRNPFEAVKLHREALALWTSRLGEDAAPVGACRHSLAQALHRTGDFEGARREMAVAVLITGRAFGKDHVDTHIARFELGRFEVDCGQVEEGLRAMEDARAAVRERLGAEHPVVKSMDRWL
jgi:tetratricopeptide (TPR) repeat protein